MKKMEPKPPNSLSRSARRLWVDIQREYAIQDSAGLELLSDLCAFRDRRDKAREILLKEGSTIKDRFDQVQAHPATRIERDASAAMGRILKALNLDLEPLKNVGRPAGR